LEKSVVELFQRASGIWILAYFFPEEIVFRVSYEAPFLSMNPAKVIEMGCTRQKMHEGLS
jgi:hypothetical protein